ncbi:MAG: Wadjet anti-phage system protein JetD domain-containing protein [Clostridium sp.]
MWKLKSLGYVSLDEIKKAYGVWEHSDVVVLIEELCDKGRLKPVPSSELTPHHKRIHTKYRIIKKEEEDFSELIDELSFQYHNKIQIDYYRNNLKMYKIMRSKLLRLNEYLFRNSISALKEISINERSYEIFEDEKFLASSEGATLLRNINLDVEKELNVYRTPEPFFYNSTNRDAGQTVLIVENKDTYHSLVKMIVGNEEILGRSISTIIYGEGKKILSSLPQAQYDVTLSYLLNEKNEFLYWGDIDKTGLFIYAELKKRMKELTDIKIDIRLFEDAYAKMIEKLGVTGRSPMLMRKQQTENHSGALEYINNSYLRNEIGNIILRKEYVPQEVLNRFDLGSE